MPWVFQAIEYSEAVELRIPPPAPAVPGGIRGDYVVWQHSRIARLEGPSQAQGSSREVARFRDLDAWCQTEEIPGLAAQRARFFAAHEAVQWEVKAPTPLVVLGLSTRARNALACGDIRTVEALQHLPPQELRRFRNLGRRSQAEVMAQLAAWEARQPVDAATSEPYWQQRYNEAVTQRNALATAVLELEADVSRLAARLRRLGRQCSEDGMV